jgi:magnesium-transporting ATPase (P-type)
MGADKEQPAETAKVSIDEEVKEAQGGDVVSSLHGATHPQSKIKNHSDLKGMQEGVKPGRPRRRVKAVSDISDLVLSKRLKNSDEHRHLRQISASELVKSFNQAPFLRFDDLKLADTVAAYGPSGSRDVTDEEFEEIMKDDDPGDFVFNHKGLTSEEAEARLLEYGRNELPEKVDPKWLIFLRQFWAPMPIMIWIAIIIEAGIQNFIDMGILLFIQFANASISFYETTKAGNAVAALKSSLKPSATVKRDGEWKVIDGATVVPGDTVLLGSGSAIPADCRVNDSEIDVDQAALTGESLPVTFFKGDSCKMGSTVVRGEVEVRLYSVA